MSLTLPTGYTQFEKLEELVGLVRKLEATDAVQAIQYAEQGLEIAKNLNNYPSLVDLETSLGRIHLLQGRFYDSLSHLAVALETARQHLPEDVERLALIHNYHGIVYHDKHNLEVALYHFTEVLKSDLPNLKVRAYNNMGSLYINAKDYDQAMHFLEEGERCSIELDEYFCRTYIYENIARIHQISGKYETSNHFYQLAKEQVRKQPDVNNNHILATILNRMGVNYRFLKAFTQARQMLEEGLRMASEHGYLAVQCECLCDLGLLALEEKKTEEFLRLHEESLRLSSASNLRQEEIFALSNLKAYHLNRGDHQAAFEVLSRIDTLKSEKLTELEHANMAQILGQREIEIFQLKEKNQKILRQNQELEQFARIVAHDLKEPLRNINSYATLLVRRYENQLDADADEFIGFISGNVVRMNRLLEDLLQYTSLEQSEIVRKAIPLVDIVDSVRYSLSEKINSTGTTFEVGPLPVVWANHLHMELLFQNLIQNAIKFRRDGIPCCLRIEAFEEEKYFEIRVCDNGIGIDEEYHDRIFKIFKRLDRQNYEGTGIGLAVCEKVVNYYGGTIWVSSIKGEGSTFHFTIPKTLN